jgi:hypothetical protein
MITGMLFWILLIVTILTLGLFVYAWTEEEEELMVTALGITAFVVMFGWVLIGTSISAATRQELVSGNILRDNNGVYVAYQGSIVLEDNTLQFFKKYQSTNAITLNKIVGINMYNSPVKTNYTVFQQ